MTNHELETQLRKALHSANAPVRPAHVQQTLTLTKAALSKRTDPKRLSCWGFLGTQVRFIGWKIWLFQIVTLLLMTGALFPLRLNFLGSLHTVRVLLVGCSILVFMTALPFLSRSRRYQMCEVEMAAKVSGSKQLGAKLLIISMGDFSMLCSLFCFALAKTDLRPGVLCLYLLLPFLSSASGLLYLIGHTPVSRLAQNSVVVCAGLFLGFTLLTRLVSTSRNLTLIGSIACVLLIFACAYQAHTLFYKSPYEEIQLL